ncbi:phosphohistidine phosphatase SixA [Cerasicoccus maritimus]|uniref:phosphohistidine phosphatase SixA n=1 Tax=Cerasicoccus maritimus TaxID=490089 RepID=UPI002852998E|nr:phosphohistidine phosphatase SixA [Cerasicoccus maritimus]
MKLFLLRHAEATYDAPTDQARQLTPKGERSIAKLCDRLKTKEFSQLAVIYHSTLVRARQTAELFRDEMQLKTPLQERTGLAPMDDPIALGAFLLECKEDAMLVGHNPHLTMLSAWLLTGSPFTDCIDFKKSGLLCLERISPPNKARPAGVWVMRYFITSRAMES